MFFQGNGFCSLLPSIKAIALPYQSLMLTPKPAIELFLSLANSIQQNCTNARNPMIVTPMFIITPMTNICMPLTAKALRCGVNTLSITALLLLMQILVLQVCISIGCGRVPVPPYTYPSMATATDVVFICGELVRSLLALFRDITLDQRHFIGTCQSKGGYLNAV